MLCKSPKNIHHFFARYFECPEDCAVFLALNRVTSSEYDQLQTQVPNRRLVAKQFRPNYNVAASSSNHRPGSSFVSNTSI